MIASSFAPKIGRDPKISWCDIWRTIFQRTDCEKD